MGDQQAMRPETREAFRRAMAETTNSAPQTYAKHEAEIMWQEVGSAEPETPRYEPSPVHAAIKHMSVRGQE